MRDHQVHNDRPNFSKNILALGLGVTVLAVAYAVTTNLTQNRVASRPADDAPPRTLKTKPRSDLALVGRTMTINRPRHELFAFCADLSNLPHFMQSLDSVLVNGDVAIWKIAAPMGPSIQMETRMTAHVENEVLSWASTENSHMKATGRIAFKDAPAGRGTELEAELSFVPPLGEVGRIIGTLFQTDPLIQGRRELRRFKMLMETGEIATNKNHKKQY